MLDDELIKNACVAAVVFCGWLAVGVINRRERWVFKSTVTAVSLVLLYAGMVAVALFVNEYIVRLGPR